MEEDPGGDGYQDYAGSEDELAAEKEPLESIAEVTEHDHSPLYSTISPLPAQLKLNLEKQVAA